MFAPDEKGIDNRSLAQGQMNFGYLEPFIPFLV